MDGLYSRHYGLDGGPRNVTNRHLGIATNGIGVGSGMERSSALECSISQDLDGKPSTPDGASHGTRLVALYGTSRSGEHAGPSVMASRGVLFLAWYHVVVLVLGLALRRLLAPRSRRNGGKLFWTHRIGWRVVSSTRNNTQPRSWCTQAVEKEEQQ